MSHRLRSRRGTCRHSAMARKSPGLGRDLPSSTKPRWRADTPASSASWSWLRRVCARRWRISEPTAGTVMTPTIGTRRPGGDYLSGSCPSYPPAASVGGEHLTPDHGGPVMPFVRTQDGTQLFFSDWGHPAGPLVVFAHAWGLSGDMWNAQLPALLEAGVRCVTYDRRGHGRSARPRNGYDLDSLADDLAVLLSHLDASGAVLVGHSLGAAEVVRYLSRHGSGRAAGAVLSAPTMPVLLRGPGNPGGV